MLNAIARPTFVHLAAPKPAALAPPAADSFVDGAEKGSQALLKMVSHVDGAIAGVAAAWGAVELLHRAVPIATGASFLLGTAAFIGGIALGSRLGEMLGGRVGQWTDKLGDKCATMTGQSPAAARATVKTAACMALAAPALIPMGLAGAGFIGMGGWVVANGALTRAGIIKA